MKFSFKFSNVLGSVYNKGTLRFTVDGNSVLSPVGNKVVCYDLKNNKSNAIPIEVDYNFSQLALNPKGTLLLASTEKTQLYMCSLVTGNILHRKDFKKLGTKITALSFSPDGLYYVVCGGNKALVYLTPGIAYSGTGRELSPFKIHKVFKAHFDETLCVAWSANSKLIAVGSKDLTVKIFPIEKFANVPSLINLAGHTGDIVDCFFANNEYDLNLYTLSRNNQICIWEASLKSEQLDNENGENLQYTKVNRFHFNEHLKTQKSVSLTSAAYHSKIKLLVTGFSNGAFLLYELPEFNLIHSLELSTTGSIDSVAINCSGDWIAIGSSVGSGDSMELQKDRSSHSQLIVWEWQSETFILKQSGTGTGITNVCECVSYSPDGSYIASGGTDGKIKLWNSFTGFCFATFAEEHKGPISALHFLSNKGGKVLVSASLDGTVRAFDLHRYRNFRTLTAPSEMRSSQFICLAIDEVGGDFIAAGSQNFFHIFLWSLKTGRLLECLSGHEGPVSGVSFSPTINMLVSCSWDRTVRIWSLFEGPKCTREVISLGNEALSVVFRPDGNQIAVSTLNGNIQFFDPHSAEMCGVGIEGKDDLGMSQSESDLIKDTSKYFSSICYSSDGAYVLGGGSSKYICLYNVQEKLLVKKFGITWNYSMDGMFEYITKRKIAEFGFNLELIKQRAKNSEFAPVALPGVKKGDFSAREANPIIAVNCVQFSPTMRSFIIASTEGILIYSLDTVNSFDPYQLDTNVNPNSVRETLGRNEFSDALIQALKLNEEYLIKEVIESTPVEEISFVLRNLTLNYVEKCLQYLANAIESTKHLELYLIWCNTALKQHGILLKNNNSNTSSLMAVIRLLQRNLSNHFYAIGKICDMNKYYIKFIELASKTRSRINDDSTDDILLEMDVSEN